MKIAVTFFSAMVLCSSCAPEEPASSTASASSGAVERCGPSVGVVARVIDGDTVELASGEKVRYLMVDTPETSSGQNECFGAEAVAYNTEIVLGQEVELSYDVECTDQFGRLLAYVEAPDGEINSLLVARGYACVLEIPPNGAERSAEFAALEAAAESAGLGLWRECPNPCAE